MSYLDVTCPVCHAPPGGDCRGQPLHWARAKLVGMTPAEHLEFEMPAPRAIDIQADGDRAELALEALDVAIRLAEGAGAPPREVEALRMIHDKLVA